MFNVGDIVRAKLDEDGNEQYSITTSDVECEVIGVTGGSEIIVKTLNLPITYNFHVFYRHFELVMPLDLENK